MPTKTLHNALPVIGLLYSATMWGMLWYPLRLLEHAGIGGLWATLVLFGAAFGVGAWAALPKLRAVQGVWPPLLGLMAANGWCNVAFILAVLDGNIVRVTLLFFLSPLWATLLARVFLRENVSMHAIGVLALAMGGAVTMLWVPELSYPWPQSAADWMAISSGVAFAISNVFIRQTETVPLPLKTAFAWAGVALTALVWIGVSNTPVPSVPPGAWLGAAALGVGGILTMTIAVQYGISRMPVHQSSVILLFELVASTLSSQLLTSEIVHTREWIGGILITLAAYLSSRSHLEGRRED